MNDLNFAKSFVLHQYNKQTMSPFLDNLLKLNQYDHKNEIKVIDCYTISKPINWLKIKNDPSKKNIIAKNCLWFTETENGKKLTFNHWKIIIQCALDFNLMEIHRILIEERLPKVNHLTRDEIDILSLLW